MEIRLRPELEALIREDVERGPYQTINEFVERAIALLHDQETWLSANRVEIETKIAAGYAAAQRGELIEADEVRAKLKKIKIAQRDELPGR